MKILWCDYSNETSLPFCYIKKEVPFSINFFPKIFTEPAVIKAFPHLHLSLSLQKKTQQTATIPLVKLIKSERIGSCPDKQLEDWVQAKLRSPIPSIPTVQI